MKPKAVCAVRAIHKKLDVFPDADVRGKHVYAENANNGASIVDKHEHAGKMPAESTHYFDSFSNIVFVSSSVRGLILASL